MTVPEIASQLRIVLGFCVNPDTEVSPAQRIHFAAAQNDCSDEQIISFWLSVSNLDEHHRSSNFIEWMILLEHNTAPPGNN
jgi:hypothetical protein